VVNKVDAPPGPESGYATRKGARQAERIIQAAYRCVTEHGYSGTSVQRIADDAGVQKRMVLYYFESKERLMEQLVRRVGSRVLARVEEAVAGLEDPSEIATVGVERMWSEITSDRKLRAAYFGVVAESVTDPSLRRAIADVNDGYRGLILRTIERGRRHGYELPISDESLTTIMIATMQGLTLQFLVRGETEELREAIADFEDWLGSLAKPSSAG
jgi:AcrR family transcriptional regulator